VKTPSLRPFSAAELVPPLAAVVCVVLFTVLGFWQLDRAEQKRALQEAFAASAEPRDVRPGIAPAPFEPLRASGRYLADRQFLIDNIVQDGQLGFYVITPLELDPQGPLLLVNRGWLPKANGEPPLDADPGPQTVSGRAGHLPRVGLRPGEPFQAGDRWPRHATFPTTEEIAAALGRDVLPFVLLADPAPGSPMLRRWEPAGMGPERHLGYAVQWFALALAVVVVSIVVYRRKGRSR
jgi:surfeit locus 1 family protein